MRFVFRFDGDGQFEVIGNPDDATAEAYRRSGPYQLDHNQLISSAINEGQPVQIYGHGDELILIVDESLWFQLRRQAAEPLGIR
jgi:hypothetical protein